MYMSQHTSNQKLAVVNKQLWNFPKDALRNKNELDLGKHRLVQQAAI